MTNEYRMSAQDGEFEPVETELTIFDWYKLVEDIEKREFDVEMQLASADDDE